MDPKECVRQRTVKQIGNVTVSQFREQIAEVVTVILQKNAFLGVCTLRILLTRSSSSFSELGRETLLPVVPCAQSVQPSTLTLGANMPWFTKWFKNN